MRQLSIPARGKRSRGRASLAARSRTRQAERTRATRRKLLDAAKRIFAQDGFEAARLEDIAAGAGYTRGAFYANFKSKEDIFFALFEEWVRERIESFTSAVRRHSDPARKASGSANPLRGTRHGPPPGPDLHGIQAVCPASPRGACPAAEQAPPHSRVVRRAVFRNHGCAREERFRLTTRRPRPASERSRKGCCWNTCSTPRRCRMAMFVRFWAFFSIRFFQAAPRQGRRRVLCQFEKMNL